MLAALLALAATAPAGTERKAVLNALRPAVERKLGPTSSSSFKPFASKMAGHS